MKRTVTIILLVTLSAFLLTAAAIATYYLLNGDRADNVHEINLTVNEKEIVEFKDVFILPGESAVYTVNLLCDVSSEARLTFDFSETVETAAEKATLKKFAYVKIVERESGNVICDKLLEDLFLDENVIKMTVMLDSEKPLVYDVIYYIPEETGNEAQNAEAYFELLIETSNEWRE